MKKIKYILSILFSIYTFILTVFFACFFYFNRSINKEYARSEDLLVGLGVVWILIAMVWLICYNGKKIKSIL